LAAGAVRAADARAALHARLAELARLLAPAAAACGANATCGGDGGPWPGPARADGHDGAALARTGTSPLHLAAAAGAGADLLAAVAGGARDDLRRARDGRGRTPAHVAAAAGFRDTAAWLADERLWDAADGDGATPRSLLAAENRPPRDDAPRARSDADGGWGADRGLADAVARRVVGARARDCDVDVVATLDAADFRRDYARASRPVPRAPASPSRARGTAPTQVLVRGAAAAWPMARNATRRRLLAAFGRVELPVAAVSVETNH